MKRSLKSSVKRSASVSLGEFAYDALVEEEATGDADISASVAKAIRCYLNDKGSAVPGWPHPPFLRRRKSGHRVELQLSIDSSLWTAMADEAEAQGVSVQQLLEHAVLYFVAEVDAGRVTERILDDLEKG